MRSRNSIQLAAFSAFLMLSVAGRSAGQEQIQWLEDLDQAKAIAARDGKLLLVHFWSERCGPCKNLDTFVFPRPDVARAMHQNYVPVKINTDEQPGLTASFQIDRIPQDVFLLPDGKVVAKQVSQSKANHYIDVLEVVATRARSGSPTQGMNGLTSGRARVAGLQSNSDSVPVVSASKFDGQMPGRAMSGQSPSIQVTDRMDPRQDAANLANNYSNGFGQPPVPDDNPYDGASASRGPQTPISNPYAPQSRSNFQTTQGQTTQGQTTQGQKMQGQFPQGQTAQGSAMPGNYPPRDPTQGLSMPRGASSEAPASNASPAGPAFANSMGDGNRTATQSGSRGLQMPPQRSTSNPNFGTAGQSYAGAPNSPRQDISAAPSQNANSNRPNVGAGTPEYPATFYGSSSANQPGSSSPSNANRGLESSMPRNNAGLNLPPASGIRSGGEVAIRQSADSPELGRSDDERQYTDPSRFAVSPLGRGQSSPPVTATNRNESHGSQFASNGPGSLTLPNLPQRPAAQVPTQEQAPSQEQETTQGLTMPQGITPNAQSERERDLSRSSTGQSQETTQEPQSSTGGSADQVALPAPANGEPPLALDGFCPITLVEHKTWQKGGKDFGCIHRGKLYLFCCAAHRDRFLQFPDRFAPMLSGFDPVIYAEEHRLVEGKREHGVFAGGRVYMFSSEETLNQFYSRVDHYTAVTFQAMGLQSAPASTAQGGQDQGPVQR